MLHCLECEDWVVLCKLESAELVGSRKSGRGSLGVSAGGSLHHAESKEWAVYCVLRQLARPLSLYTTHGTLLGGCRALYQM